MDLEIISDLLGLVGHVFDREIGEEAQPLKEVIENNTTREFSPYVSGWYLERAVRFSQSTLFTIASGHIGQGPPGLREGDLLCIILTCHMPLVMRPVDDHLLLVGSCLVPYLMQAWQKYLISGIDRYRCQNCKVSILSIKYRFPEPNSPL
jgi:hypothetical protein